MRLGVFINMSKDIGHFGSVIKEVVYINFKLVLQLKLLIIKCRVGPVCK